MGQERYLGGVMRNFAACSLQVTLLKSLQVLVVRWDRKVIYYSDRVTQYHSDSSNSQLRLRQWSSSCRFVTGIAGTLRRGGSASVVWPWCSVSLSPSAGGSSVHFHLWLAELPRKQCEFEHVRTRTKQF